MNDKLLSKITAIVDSYADGDDAYARAMAEKLSKRELRQVIANMQQLMPWERNAICNLFSTL